MRRLAATMLLLGSTSPALAEVSGMATPMGGDRLVVGSQRLQLWGIDAPEPQMPCLIEDVAWDCYEVAKRELELIVANEPVVCDEMPPDRQRRVFAVCRIGDRDIAEEMVRAGMALAVRNQSEDYVAAETEAQDAKVGLWRGFFVTPWEWRESVRGMQ